MAFSKDSGRQQIISATKLILFSELVSGVGLSAIDLPPGAIVQGGDVTVVTAFNSATTDVARVGDASSANRYAGADINLAVAGRTALTLTGFKVTSSEPAVLFKWTGAGAAPSAGVVRLTVNYIRDGRAAFTEGKGV